ncbi:hypothetical protein QT995_14575 [Microcoleus sp. S36b_A3]|uniref:hypothetical protein n=1 Tax=unclassified Microcoleus TaxID=2642155 RepID=UPI002FD6A5EA
MLRGFLQEVMQLAVYKGYITLEEKEELSRPGLASSTDAVVLSKSLVLVVFWAIDLFVVNEYFNLV